MNDLVQVLQQIYVLLDDGNRRALRHVDLTPTQYSLLRSIAESADRELTVSRLAQVMLCTRGNATRLVRRLEEAGLVVTRGDARDQRLVLVGITADGARRLGDADRSLADADERRFAGMPDDDLRALTEAATALSDMLAKDLDRQDRPD